MEIYHILSRGVDKRKIFLDQQDYFRFIHDLFEFNDQAPANTTFYSFKKSNQNNVIGRRKFEIERKPRKLLVDICAFCLMPNHYHLILIPRSENNIFKFMKKLNMGYARYFNERYDRKGALFEGRYKSILVENESHFIHLPYYIHFNPLDLISPGWRQQKIKNYKEAIKFLENYRWSSHLDYLGKENFPSVTQRDFLLDFFDGSKKYEKNVKEWLMDIDLANNDFKNIILE